MKKIVYFLIAFIVLIGVYLFLKSNFSSKTGSQTDILPTPTEALPTVSDKVKITLISREGGRSVDLSIDGLESSIKSIEYELTYLTGAGLARGVLGKISTDGTKKIEKNDIVLGTCSSGKCVYDSGVESVDLALKFNAENGSFVFQKSFPLK